MKTGKTAGMDADETQRACASVWMAPDIREIRSQRSMRARNDREERSAVLRNAKARSDIRPNGAPDVWRSVPPLFHDGYRGCTGAFLPKMVIPFSQPGPRPENRTVELIK